MNSPSPSASGASILLVDNGEAQWRRLAEQLDQDHRVSLAEGVADALRLLEEETPDLLLLTAMAADGSPIELESWLPRLRADGQSMILLGEVGPERISAALEMGVSECIEPGAPDSLALRRVAGLLNLNYCRELLQSQTMLDSLTGLANRRRFDEFLPAAFAHAQRRSEAIGLIVFDLDDFAAYNDALGRAAGDEVLLHVGRTLSSAHRRPLDLFARFGGDRFACVLPDTDLAGARAVAELFLADVEALSIDHPAGCDRFGPAVAGPRRSRPAARKKGRTPPRQRLKRGNIFDVGNRERDDPRRSSEKHAS